MRNKFKSFIAVFISFVLSFAFLPLELIFADVQAGTDGLRINRIAPQDPNDTSYTLNLTWKNAVWPDNGTYDANSERFDIEYSNISRGGGATVLPVKPIDKTQAVQSKTTDPLPLLGGSIYSFNVTPVHTHTTLNSQNQSVTTEHKGTKSPESLFMTDIAVEAIGIGNQIKVIWDNPTYSGQNLFSGYRIYLQKIVDNKPTGSINQININNDKITFKDGKAEYLIDTTLDIAQFYEVRVEPLYAGGSQPLREARKTTITLPGNTNKTVSIAYTAVEEKLYRSVAYTEPRLRVLPEDQTHARLLWDKFPATNGKGRLVKVEISKSVTQNPKLDPTLGEWIPPIAVLYGDNAININSILTENPEVPTYYKVEAFYDDDMSKPMRTNVYKYDPKNNSFAPYIPVVLRDRVVDPKITVEMDWKAFTRNPYNVEEADLIPPEYNGVFVDDALTYKIWITDTRDALNDPAIENNYVYEKKATSLNVQTKTLADGSLEFFYQDKFAEYVKKTGVSSYSKPTKLEENKVYYVKILATRDNGEKSQYAYHSFYIPPSGNININPNMITNPPVRIQKVDGVEQITDKSIGIEWDTQWFEAYNSDPTVLNWFSKIAVNESKKVVFNKEADKYPSTKLLLYSFKSKEDILTKLKSMGVSDADLPAIRKVDLGKPGETNAAKYEIHTVTYDEMLKQGGYEKYLQTLLAKDKAEEAGISHELWSEITAPKGTPPTLNFEVTKTDAPTKEEIKPNTPYVIFFRPFNQKAAYYPSYITATTVDKGEEVPFDPTVPTLTVITTKTTDTSITVWWNSSKSLDYELSFSDLISDYPDKGVIVTAEEINKNGVAETGKDKNGKDVSGTSYTIEGLFPDTFYNIWIRSFPKTNATEKADAIKNWSNPVGEKTKDILPPDPPKGLGPASKDSLAIYNKENKTELTAISNNQIIVEWMKDFNDINNTQKPPTAPPPSGGTNSSTSAPTALITKQLLDSYMVKYGALTPNTYYHFRAKTILKITKTEKGIARDYSYVIEMSKDKKFKEFVSLTVPATQTNSPNTAGDTFKQKESVWSEIVSLKTGKKDPPDEYDEDKNPDLYPLPNKDFEATYDSVTKTIYYRFRSDSTGVEDGLKDNMVDQRFISKLVQSKVYTYEINLPAPKDTIVLNRTVEMPYSIWKALDERKISLKLKSDNSTFTLSPESLNNSLVKSASDIGTSSKLKVNMKTNAKDTPSLESDQNYAALPQQLGINITTPKRELNLTELAKPVKIELKIDNKYEKLQKNIAAFSADKNSAGWVLATSNYNTKTGVLSFESRKLGSYAAIARDEPASTPNDAYRDEMLHLTSKIDIKDLKTYSSTKEMSANEFNNLVAAVSFNKKEVTLNADMSESDFNKLGKSKLLVSGEMVSNEAAINSLVKLYEIKTKTPIKGVPELTNSIFANEKDFSKNVDKNMVTSLLKAEKIGFYDKETTINPKENLKLGLFLHMVNIILEDSL